MNNTGFEILFDWLSNNAKDDINRHFAATLKLSVNGACLTQLEDLQAKTVRNQIVGNAWQLASWFSGNWWRLRWEPETKDSKKNTDWLCAHNLAAAGGGFVWPSAIFVSDGVEMEISTPAENKNFHRSEIEPIRYLNQINEHIEINHFERTIDHFIESIIARHSSLKIQERSLVDLWSEILNERADPNLTRQRKTEAIAGYDPDDAPHSLLEEIYKLGDALGTSALDEVTGEAGRNGKDLLASLKALSLSPQNTFTVSMPQLTGNINKIAGKGLPWQQAERLARYARKEWSLGEGSISSKDLTKLIDSTTKIITNEEITPLDIPAAIRSSSSNGTFHLCLNRPLPTSRRFAIGRLIGDYLFFSNNEKLHPATNTKTYRQKFQRAFAQEFLCPINSLEDKIGPDIPNEDDIAEAAAYFEVSPLMIQTTLVNHNKLDREALTTD